MKPIDLLKSLGTVKDAYVIRAEEFRQGNCKANVRTLSAKRVWMIAAVIILSLFLVGCTIAYVLSLQEMTIGQTTHIEPEHYGPNWVVIEETQTTYDVLSVQSFSDSPNQRATREWRS